MKGYSVVFYVSTYLLRHNSFDTLSQNLSAFLAQNKDPIGLRLLHWALSASFDLISN